MIKHKRNDLLWVRPAFVATEGYGIHNFLFPLNIYYVEMKLKARSLHEAYHFQFFIL